MGFLGGLIRAGVAGAGGALKGANAAEQTNYERDRQRQQDALQTMLLNTQIENIANDNQRADAQLEQTARARQLEEVMAKRREMLDAQKAAESRVPPPLYDPNADPAVQRERTFQKEGLGRYGEKPEPVGMSPRDIQQETGVRKEYADVVKTYDILGQSYRKIQQAATDPSPAGDLSLIFGFMRILDPTSTVREGEFATAQNTGTIPQQITAQYNKLLSGEGRLSTQQRADFLRQATGLIASQRGQLSRIQDRYRGIAKGYGMNPENVVYDPFEGVGADNSGGGSRGDDPGTTRMADRFEEIRAANPDLSAAQITQMVKDEFSRKSH